MLGLFGTSLYAVFVYLCIFFVFVRLTHLHIIFDTSEQSLFKKYTICGVYLALCHMLYLCICIFVFARWTHVMGEQGYPLFPLRKFFFWPKNNCLFGKKRRYWRRNSQVFPSPFLLLPISPSPLLPSLKSSFRKLKLSNPMPESITVEQC